MVEIKEEVLDFCNNWRIKNKKPKRFISRQNHVTGYIQKGLDIFLISNMLQESVAKILCLLFQ